MTSYYCPSHYITAPQEKEWGRKKIRGFFCHAFTPSPLFPRRHLPAASPSPGLHSTADCVLRQGGVVAQGHPAQPTRRGLVFQQAGILQNGLKTGHLGKAQLHLSAWEEEQLHHPRAGLLQKRQQHL